MSEGDGGLYGIILVEPFITYGDLEQYFLWAISALAKRAVAALVPRWVLDRDRFDA